jgi:hypothetical protein
MLPWSRAEYDAVFLFAAFRFTIDQMKLVLMSGRSSVQMV